MSKLVKKLVARDIQHRLKGVEDAIVVGISALDGNANYNLRKTLREKNIGMLVVKRTLAARATDGTSLRAAFDDLTGSIAVVYGCEDFVSLTKSVTALAASNTFEKFEIRGGAMDGDALTADQVKAISKWPTRQEQIALLVGQILSPGSNLVGQLLGPGRKLASQVKQLIENIEGAGSGENAGSVETAGSVENVENVENKE